MAEDERLQYEQTWLASSDVEEMCRKILGWLEYEGGVHVSTRKGRLFMVACLRRVWRVFKDERTRKLVEGLESLCDGNITKDEWVRQWEQAGDPPNPDALDTAFCSPEERPTACAMTALWHAGNDMLCGPAEDICVSYDTYVSAAWARDAAVNAESEELAQAKLLRCIFGNPFQERPPKKGVRQWKKELRRWQTWNDGTVRRIAQGIYDERAFRRLPILVDALRDACCDDVDMIQHCRSKGPHARSCWVVDLLLGKT
jgi:hypothetical protein